MTRALASLSVLLLAVLHAPNNAQAIVSPFIPEFFLTTSEPATLLLTGIALLSLARASRRRDP